MNRAQRAAHARLWPILGPLLLLALVALLILRPDAPPHRSASSANGTATPADGAPRP